MLEKTRGFIKDHKKELIITGLGLVTIGLTVVATKQYTELKALKKENLDLLTKVDNVNILKNKIEVIHEAMSEGMVQEAIATTTRKLNVREDKIAHLLNKGNLDCFEQQALNKAKGEAEVFRKRLDAFNELAKQYFIAE
jgi:hypothetical protein